MKEKLGNALYNIIFINNVNCVRLGQFNLLFYVQINMGGSVGIVKIIISSSRVGKKKPTLQHRDFCKVNETSFCL